MQSTKYKFEPLLNYFDKSPITYHPTVGREHDSLDLYYASLLKVGVIAYDGDRIILKIITDFTPYFKDINYLPKYIDDMLSYTNRFNLKPIITINDSIRYISTLYEFHGVKEEFKKRIGYYLDNPEEYWKKVIEEAEKTGVYRPDII